MRGLDACAPRTEDAEITMNRRKLLTSAALGAAGVALSGTRASAEVSPEMTALSAYMSAAGARVLPADVAEQAKHHLLDTLAAMVSGSELMPGEAALRYA